MTTQLLFSDMLYMIPCIELKRKKRCARLDETVKEYFISQCYEKREAELNFDYDTQWMVPSSSAEQS